MKKKSIPRDRTIKRRFARKGIHALDSSASANFTAHDLSVEVHNYGPGAITFRSIKEFERPDWLEIHIPEGHLGELPHGFYVAKVEPGKNPQAGHFYGKQKLKYSVFGFAENSRDLLTPRPIPEGAVRPEADFGLVEPRPTEADIISTLPKH